MRYENLCSKPVETIESVFEFCEMEIPNTGYGKLIRPGGTGVGDEVRVMGHRLYRYLGRYYR